VSVLWPQKIKKVVNTHKSSSDWTVFFFLIQFTLLKPIYYFEYFKGLGLFIGVAIKIFLIKMCLKLLEEP